MKLEFECTWVCDCCDYSRYEFHCPSCGNEHAMTSLLSLFCFEIEKVGDEFWCEECDTTFVLKSMNDSTDYEDWEWEIKEG